MLFLMLPLDTKHALLQEDAGYLLCTVMWSIWNHEQVTAVKSLMKGARVVQRHNSYHV